MLTTLALLVPLVLATVTGAVFYVPDLDPAPLERRYAVPPSQFVEVDGLRMHVRDEGRGEPIVLLHGLTSNLFIWRAWAERLRGEHRVISLDLPGHGLTGPDAAGRYQWGQMADQVVRLLDRLGIDRATVVGNSVGGAVAWQMAVRHPDRVGRLVLISPVGYPSKGRPPLIFRLLAQPLAGKVVLRFVGERAFLGRARAVYGDPAGFDEADGRLDFAMLRRAGNRDALVGMFGGGSPLPDPQPLLAKVRAPTLIMWGSADPITAPAQAARFVADIPGAELVALEGAGHVPMIEMPDESAAALRDFLRKTEASPG